MTARRGESNYRVINRIATGGMAEVYEAEAKGLADFKKHVAIKRVLPHLAANERFIRMFLDEARLSARLNHRNIVQVFDVGHADGTYFIVMEYVDGVTLKAAMEHVCNRGRTLAVPLAVHVAIEMCSALHYAHELTDSAGRPLRIVHRDVSPSNVLIARSGGVKLADFGLAKAATQIEKTDPGMVKGKFGYLAPETASGQDADARADLFASGIILWEMLAGRPLFPGTSDYETVRLVQRCEIPGITQINPNVPPALDQVVRKALARDKTERFPTASAMARALTEVLFDHRMVVNSDDLSALAKEIVNVAGGAAAPQLGQGANSVLGLQTRSERPVEQAFSIQSIVALDRRLSSTPAVVEPLSTQELPQEHANVLALSLAGLAVLGIALVSLVFRLHVRTAAFKPRASQAQQHLAAGIKTPTDSGRPDLEVSNGLDLRDGGMPPSADNAQPPALTARPHWPNTEARMQVLTAIQRQVNDCSSRLGPTAHRARVFVEYEGVAGGAVSVQIQNRNLSRQPIAGCIGQAIHDHTIEPFRAAVWRTIYNLVVP